jgi:Ca-activated chloride channel family protein
MATRCRSIVAVFIGVLAVSMHAQQPSTARPQTSDDGFRFKSGIEVINVTATVSDASGRFVSGLQSEDFSVYEDDRLVPITHFSADRVPVSLGIALDTSGSMAGEKIREARTALDRFLYDLLDKQDEIFLYRFSNYPILLQGWTTDRQAVTQALGRITPNGGTAMYDAVAEAVPLAGQGQNQKKAILLISDGNDTASHVDVRQLRQTIRESEVLVYAIGIDGDSEPVYRSPSQPPPPRLPVPFPFPPRPGRGGRFPQIFGGQRPQGGWSRNSDRVNVAALRDITDDSGGRTEIVRDPRDLNPSTASIADELSKQYYLGYPSNAKNDGRWHSIRVEVRNRTYRVRARRGYVAN